MFFRWHGLFANRFFIFFFIQVSYCNSTAPIQVLEGVYRFHLRFGINIFKFINSLNPRESSNIPKEENPLHAETV